MAAYLEACLEEAHGDAAFIAKALGDIARAKGMTQVARDAGLSRESLYKALSGERSPAFETILKVMGALGLKLNCSSPQPFVLLVGERTGSHNDISFPFTEYIGTGHR
jgi:probable addiction module antidote protein